MGWLCHCKQVYWFICLVHFSEECRSDPVLTSQPCKRCSLGWERDRAICSRAPRGVSWMTAAMNSVQNSLSAVPLSLSLSKKSTAIIWHGVPQNSCWKELKGKLACQKRILGTWDTISRCFIYISQMLIFTNSSTQQEEPMLTFITEASFASLTLQLMSICKSIKW